MFTGNPKGLSPEFGRSTAKAIKNMGESAAGEFLNAETILNILEGGEYGQVEQSLFGRMSDRSNWKATRLENIYKQMKPLFSQYSIKERLDFSRKDIGSAIGIPGLTRENSIVVALLHGNKEGRERLSNYGWSDRTQKDIISLLEAKDMQLVEGIWKLFDQDLWPELKALNERTRGLAPKKVDPMSFETRHGTATGGYFRLKYDTNLDERAQHFDETAAVKEMLGGSMGMSAKTNQGTSMERQKGVKMRPRLDFGVFVETVNETVHDLAYREAVADTMRLLNEEDIQNVIKTVAGVPAYRALVTRVREVAAPPRNPSGFIEKTLSIARKNTIVTLLSGLRTALLNGTGIVTGFNRINAGLLLKEIAMFYSPKMMDRYRFVMEHSEYMRHRYGNGTFDRDLIRYATQNALVQRWDVRRQIARVFRPRVLVYGTVMLLITAGFITSLALRQPFPFDFVRDRASLARVVGHGDIENVYRLQLMNSTERVQRYRVAVTGLDGAALASHAEFDVGPAEARWWPVAVRLPAAAALSQGPGVHALRIEVERLADSDAAAVRVSEKSTFVVPR